MRITESRFASDFLYNVNNSQQRINEYQNQLSSGLRVNEPSDDPEAAAQVLLSVLINGLSPIAGSGT